MGIMTKLGLGGGGGGRGSTQNKFMKVLDAADLSQAVDTVCTTALQWYKMGGGFTVPAQQMLHFGYGSAELPDNQGYLYIHLVEAGPADIAGKIRLVQSNAQQTVKYVVAEYNLASTHGSVTNKAMMIALPEQTQFPLVGEDSILSLEVASTPGGKTVDISICELYVPVTIYM